jgi:hypothetical protein
MTSTAVTIRDYRTQVPGQLTADRSEWVFPAVETVNAHGKISSWIIRVRVFDHTGLTLGPDDPPPDNAFVPIEDSYFSGLMSDNLHAWIKIDTGIEGRKNKNAQTIITTGKSLGTKAATNVFMQALRDSVGNYNKKTKKIKAPTPVNRIPSTLEQNDGSMENQLKCSQTLYPPMLADKYKNKDLTSSHVWIQYKYDGVRAVTTKMCDMSALGDISGMTHPVYADWNSYIKDHQKIIDKSQTIPIMYSRTRIPYMGKDHIKNELTPVLEWYWSRGIRLYLDGELYKHGVPLQDISGNARKETEKMDNDGNAVLMDYMIYDCFIDNHISSDMMFRQAILKDLFRQFGEKLTYTKYVETHYHESGNPTLLKKYFDDAIAAKYEGIMIRLNAPYKFSYNGNRSANLLKYKAQDDDELEFVGWTVGKKGKAAGAIMVICKAANGRTFNITPAMQLPERHALAEKMAIVEDNGLTHFENHWKGKKIIVTYDDLSKDGIPQRARTEMKIRTWA